MGAGEVAEDLADDEIAGAAAGGVENRACERVADAGGLAGDEPAGVAAAGSED